MNEYKKLLEQRLAEAERADPNDAPFGMDGDAARAWHMGRGTADMVRRARAAGVEVFEVK